MIDLICLFGFKPTGTLDMIEFVVPRLVREIGDRYKDIAARNGIRNPCLYAYIGMLHTGSHSLCGFSRLAGWSQSVSTLSRSTHQFTEEIQEDFLRRHRWSLLNTIRKESGDWTFVIDTTKNLKRTFGLEGLGLWGDSNAVVFEGQNLLVIAAIHIKTGAAIPLHVLPCLKPSERKDNETANHRVIEILDKLSFEGWPKLHVVMDSWFDSAWLYEQLSSRGFTFVVQLKTIRKPKVNCSPNAKKHTFSEIFDNLERSLTITGTRQTGEQNKKYCSERTIWIAGSNKENKQIQLKVGAAYNDDEGGKAFGYYATNDLSKSGVWLWAMSRCRWNIETMFRDLKQHLGFGKFASKHANGSAIAIVIPIIILGHLRTRCGLTTPIGTLLARNRQTELIRNFNSIDSEITKHRVSIIKHRLNPVFANKKPRSSAAEEAKSEWTCKKRA